MPGASFADFEVSSEVSIRAPGRALLYVTLAQIRHGSSPEAPKTRSPYARLSRAGSEHTRRVEHKKKCISRATVPQCRRGGLTISRAPPKKDGNERIVRSQDLAYSEMIAHSSGHSFCGLPPGCSSSCWQPFCRAAPGRARKLLLGECFSWAFLVAGNARSGVCVALHASSRA